MKRLNNEDNQVKKSNIKKVQQQKVSHEKVATVRQHKEKATWKKCTMKWEMTLKNVEGTMQTVKNATWKSTT